MTRILFWILCAGLPAAQVAYRNLPGGTFGQFSPQTWAQRPKPPGAYRPDDVLQQKLTLPAPLAWRFPDPPTDEPPRFPPHFEPKVPVAADSVSATCGESLVHVEVKKNLLGTNGRVQAADVMLGSCPAVGEDPQTDVIIFEAELHGCGSELLVSENFFSYVFTLHHTPAPLGGSDIVRTPAVAVRIECQYQRMQDVSVGLVKPTWKPLGVTEASQEHLYFSLQLMTDDWQFPHQSGHFVLGDMMKFEASVKQFFHAPLRVTVDSCVATTIPNTDTVPRYAFLGNHGCLFDSQLTDSRSRFLPRTSPDKLDFEMEAFVFLQDDSGVIYITCLLTAVLATAALDSAHKACTFSDRWREASPNQHVCSCCDTDCGTESQTTTPGTQFAHETMFGPITVKDKLLAEVEL